MAEVVLNLSAVMDVEEVKYAGYRDRFPVGFVRPDKYSDGDKWVIVPFSFMPGEEADRDQLETDALACLMDVFDLEEHPTYRFTARPVHLADDIITHVVQGL